MSGAAEDDDDESISHAGLTEIFGALTLATPTWTIIRHPFRFRRYKANHGAAIHYLYAAIGFTTLIESWTTANSADLEAGGEAKPLVDAVNGALVHLAPHAMVSGTDVLPVMLLVGNLVSGFTAYGVCAWLARRNGIGPARNAAAQTLAATAYLGGVVSVFYGICLLLPGVNLDASVAQSAYQNPTPSIWEDIFGAVLIFLFYVWGRWISEIHGVVKGRIAGALFPMGLAFLSLTLFTGLFYLVLEALKAL